MLDKSLGGIIKEFREKRDGWSQLAVATEVGIVKEHLGNIERDKALPDLDLLLRLYDALVFDAEKNRDLLAVWLFKWFAAKFQHDEHRESQKTQREHKPVEIATQQQTVEIIEQVVRQSENKINRHPGQLRSLANFPDDFLPLTIIAGDRRRGHPRSTPGDVFVETAAITDLMFLPKLGLPKECQVRSDKIFALMGEEELKKEFGKTNLLVIGSPMVNLAARVLNEHCLFRYAIGKDVKAVAENIRALKFDDHEHFRVFWKMAEDPQRIDLNEYQNFDLPLHELSKLAEQVSDIFGRKTPSQYVSKFVGLEIVDPTERANPIFDRHHDYAIISLGRNRFADNDEYVTIMAAGIGAMGTAQAVRTLAEKPQKSFAHHPFGGILEAELHSAKPAPKDFEEARSWWPDRSGYTPETILENLEAALTHLAHGSSLGYLTRDQIEECRDLVLTLRGGR